METNKMGVAGMTNEELTKAIDTAAGHVVPVAPLLQVANPMTEHLQRLLET